MNTESICITGAGGQLGKALVERYPAALVLTRNQLNIADPAAVADYDWGDIDTIINAAAYTKVDEAESASGRQQAWRVNAQAVRELAKTCTERDMTFVHVSSEYVFDGTASPHTEAEYPSPLGVYGQSKAAGDMAASMVPKHYIARTSWVIGDGPNFVRTMVNLANRNIEPKVVDDQVGRLTFTSTLVDAIDRLLADKAEYGVYNVTNSGDVASWADVTRQIFDHLDRKELAVHRVATDEYFREKPNAAPRPLKSTLDLKKIRSIGVDPPDWRLDLRSYVRRQLAAGALG